MNNFFLSELSIVSDVDILLQCLLDFKNNVHFADSFMLNKKTKQNKTKNNENRQRNAQQHSFRVQQLAKRNFYEDEIALQYSVDYMKILILLHVPLY